MAENVGHTMQLKNTQTGLDMDKAIKNKLNGTMIVPVGLAIVLVPYSLLLGWNGATLILFWLVLTPGLTVYLPKLVSTNTRHLFESIAGMILFYGLMVFMIYDHYKTDYFQFMTISCVVNVILVPTITWIQEQIKDSD